MDTAPTIRPRKQPTHETYSFGDLDGRTGWGAGEGRSATEIENRRNDRSTSEPKTDGGPGGEMTVTRSFNELTLSRARGPAVIEVDGTSGSNMDLRLEKAG